MKIMFKGKTARYGTVVSENDSAYDTCVKVKVGKQATPRVINKDFIGQFCFFHLGGVVGRFGGRDSTARDANSEPHGRVGPSPSAEAVFFGISSFSTVNASA